MRRLLVVFIVANTVIFGQSRNAIGIKAGLTSSEFKNARDANSGSSNSNNSFAIGMYLKHTLNERVSMQGELLYLRKGGNIHSNGASIKKTVVYFEVPITVHYSFQNKVNLFGGFSIGYNPPDFIFNSDEYKRVDIGGVAGVGYELKRWTFDARYVYGLTKISNIDSRKNSTICFLIGYKISG